MDDIDVFLNDFYGKYNDEVLTDEKRNKIKSTYGSDHATLLKDLYGKYTNESISDEKILKIESTYNLKKKAESTSDGSESATEQNQTNTSTDSQEEGVITEEELFPKDKENKFPSDDEIKKQTGWSDEDLKKHKDSFVKKEKDYTQQDRSLKDYDTDTEPVEIEGYDNEKMNLLTEKMQDSAILTKDEIKAIDQDIERRKNGNFSAYEKLQIGLDKKATLISDFLGLKKEKDITTVTEQDRKKIIENAISKKQTDFFDNLTDEERKGFDSYLIKRNDKITKKFKEAEFVNNHIDKYTLPKEIKNFNAIEEELNSYQNKKKEDITEEDVANFNQLVSEREKQIDKIKTLENQYNVNRKTQLDSYDDLLSFDNELNLAKRDYGVYRNTISVTAEGFLNMALDTSSFVANALTTTALVKNIGDKEFLMNAKRKIQEFQKYQARSKEEFDNSIRKRTTIEDVDSIEDFGKYTSKLIFEQIPVLATIAATGSLGLGVAGASSGGDRSGQLLLGRDRGENNFTDAQIEGNSLMYAVGEFVGESITLGILNDYKKIFKSINTSKVLKNSFNQNLKNFSKSTLKGLSTANKEGLSEVYTEFIQYNSDKIGLDSDREPQYLESYVSGALIGKGIHVSSAISNWAVGAYSKKENRTKVKDNTLKILEIRNLINQGNFSDTVKKMYQEKIQSLTNDNNKIINESVENIKGLNANQISKITNINNQIRAVQITLKKQSENELNSKDDVKKSLLAEIKALSDKKDKIISNPLEKFSEPNQIKLKNEAAQQLTKEKQESGEKNFKITDEEITKRAEENASKIIEPKKETPAETTEDVETTPEVKEEVTDNAENTIPQEVLDAQVSVNTLGQSLSDATPEQKTEYNNSLKVIKDNGYNISLGKLSKVESETVLEAAQDLTPEQKTVNKPKIKMNFVTKTEMTKSDNLDKTVKANNKIKEDYKEVKKLMDCLWK